MYDFSVPNDKPGVCAKCNGTGEYRWGGGVVNGQFTGHSGPCWSCKGTGKQTKADIKRNHGYNFHKIRRIALGE
jgi:DnaJ-class molecular chaperone